MITAEHISYYIRDEAILHDASLHIAPGQVTAILGPNGAGKSTLLKCLTGIIDPNDGAVRLEGKPLGDYPLEALARKRAVLSQSNPINFPFTALEIVLMGRNPYARQTSAVEDETIALEALACVDAEELKDRVFPTLSGGEQQRVQMARILAQLWEQDDAYLFLDEPTSALDLKHQHQLLRLVRNLALDRGFGVCLILHDLQLAYRYADRVVLLKDGAVFSDGATEDVLTESHICDVFELDAELAPVLSASPANRPNIAAVA